MGKVLVNDDILLETIDYLIKDGRAYENYLASELFTSIAPRMVVATYDEYVATITEKEEG